MIYPEPPCGVLDNRPVILSKVNNYYVNAIQFFAALIIAGTVSFFTKPISGKTVGIYTERWHNRWEFKGTEAKTWGVQTFVGRCLEIQLLKLSFCFFLLNRNETILHYQVVTDLWQNVDFTLRFALLDWVTNQINPSVTWNTSGTKLGNQTLPNETI